MEHDLHTCYSFSCLYQPMTEELLSEEFEDTKGVIIIRKIYVHSSCTIIAIVWIILQLTESFVIAIAKQ